MLKRNRIVWLDNVSTGSVSVPSCCLRKCGGILSIRPDKEVALKMSSKASMYIDIETFSRNGNSNKIKIKGYTLA